MIFDRIEDFDSSLFPERFQRAFAYMKTVAPDHAKGRTEIEGNDLYMNVMEYDANIVEPRSGKLEAHRKYADIQFVLAGGEALICENIAGHAVDTPYDESKDVLFYKASGSDQTRVELIPGVFAVFFPQDGHFGKFSPASGVVKGIRKAVIKVRLD